MLDDRTRMLLRALLYPVQFEKQPELGIERVMKSVVFQNALQATSSDYLRAINSALESDENLSNIIPQGHNDEVVRRYLRRLSNELVGMAA